MSDNPQPNNSFGNGSAMRVSPVGLYANSLEEALELARITASVSQKNSPDYQQLTKESRAESLTATRSEIQKLLLSNLRNILFCQAGHIQNSIHV